MNLRRAKEGGAPCFFHTVRGAFLYVMKKKKAGGDLVLLALDQVALGLRSVHESTEDAVEIRIFDREFGYK